MRLHFTIGCYNRHRTSWCRHGFQFRGIQILFLLIMCIDAPESTTNSLSCGLTADGAGRHQFSETKKNVVLCFSFIVWIFLASLHAASRAHRSCHSVSSWDRSSNFGALGLRWWGSPGQIKNRWRLRRLQNLIYATQLSCTWWVSVQNRSPYSLMLLVPFQHSHCTFVTILFRTFAGLFINLAMCTRALFPKSETTLGLVEHAFRRVPLFTEWSGASSFEVILARQSTHSSTGTPASRTSGSWCVFHFLPRKRSWRKVSAVSILHAYL